MDFIWVLFAFLCGLGVTALALPPLVGYLIAGFMLNMMGVQPTENLHTVADLGITLMLFTIGLKINISDLIKPEVWGSTLGHMGIWVLLVVLCLFPLTFTAMLYLTDLSFMVLSLLGFALSFSSTVCIVKLLEESGEMKTRHGRLAIGVLVIQDIVAVVFLVAAMGKVPSLWAILLFLLIPARPLIGQLLRYAGHGELLPLTGIFLALGGYELFSLVGVKGDLGALILGMLLSQHPKGVELSKSLMSFKDIFLIGFFLSIGFVALPDWPMFFMALGLVLLLPLKFIMFFGLLVALRLRGRTAYLSALALTNFSEFGLIVASAGADAGWLDKEWLVVLAITVSMSFVITSLCYRHAHIVYARYKHLLKGFERSNRLPEDLVVQPKDAEILVIGMGRVGKGAFSSLHQLVGDRVWGMDADQQRIKQQQEQGMHVFVGDGEDADLWETINVESIKLVLLAMPSIEDMSNVTEQLRHAKYAGKLAAIARYEDEREQLLDAGIDKVFNFFVEAGVGFAEESLMLFEAPEQANSAPA